MWLFYALLAPFLWAIVHVLDSHCVDRVFDKPWMGVITSGLASLTVLLLIPFAAPFVSWEIHSWSIVALALVAGFLIQLSQAAYFQALASCEAGIVAAYWNMVPTLLPVVSFALWGKMLTGVQCTGIVALIFASIFFCLVDTNSGLRFRSFVIMLVASSLQVSAILIEKCIFDANSFFVGYLLITLGIILTGTAPLCHRGVRQVFRNNARSLRPAIGIIIGIEIANLAALFCSQYAVSLGMPSLVAAVETTTPAYVFVLSSALISMTGSYGDKRSGRRLYLKTMFAGLMGAGVWLVSI